MGTRNDLTVSFSSFRLLNQRIDFAAVLTSAHLYRPAPTLVHLNLQSTSCFPVPHPIRLQPNNEILPNSQVDGSRRRRSCRCKGLLRL